MPGGRPAHSIWIGFTRDSSNPKNVKAKCKTCGAVVQAIIERMKIHEQVCKNDKRENNDNEEQSEKKPRLDSMVVKTTPVG